VTQIQSLMNGQLGPNIQLKRKQETKAAALEDVSCAGLEGTPWPEEEEKERTKEEQNEDNKDAHLIQQFLELFVVKTFEFMNVHVYV